VSTRDHTADQALDRLQGPAADIAVVRAELDGLRRARAEDFRELQRLRAMHGRAMDVQDWCQDEASLSAVWRAATYIRNGTALGVDPRSAVIDGR
jgi:hypothetical protein